MSIIQDSITNLESNPFSIKMLYVATAGSHLYGTATPASDLDYKGIFLPSHPQHPFFATKKKHTQPHSFEISTGSDNSSNGKDDVDQAYFSVQQFFENLAKGEAGAMDLLFSMWNPEWTVKQDIHFVNWCKENYLKLITSNPKAFIGFATGQARRYGVKGQRYNELTNFIESTKWAVSSENKWKLDPSTKLLEIELGTLIEYKEYDHIKQTKAPASRGVDGDWIYLQVLDKLYSPYVSIGHLLTLLIAMEASYGDRVKNTDDGIDWKALSHATRATLEIKELLSTGTIKFPLKDAGVLLEIKQGKYRLDTVIGMLEQHIQDVDALMLTTTLPAETDPDFTKSYIETLYKEQ